MPKNAWVKWIKRLLPDPVKRQKRVLLLALHCFYDFKRFLKWSATVNPYESKVKHEGRIIVGYHVVEKGLSLKDPRVGFGAEKVTDLISILTDYEAKYGLDRVGAIALNVLSAYYDYNRSHGVEDKSLCEKLTRLRERIPSELGSEERGGVKLVSRQDIRQAAEADFAGLVSSRYSIRNFDAGDVDMSLIEKAVSLAIKTPSVCNRQAWKVYAFNEKDAKREILNYQHGNKGFGDSASIILVVTTELGYFAYLQERNQAFVDGGMFAMSLVYALHALGLGTCCLNTCHDHKTGQMLRKAAGISDSEVIIMMIAVGNIPEHLNVAQSPRRDLCKVLVTRNS